MRLCVPVVLIGLLLPAAWGLRCFTCWGSNPGECTRIWDCPEHYDRCSTTIASDNLVSKHCMRSDMCDRVYSNGLRCCSGDLCNGAKQTAVFVPLLLLAPLATVTLYI
ncbi:urokinase plasminogen activator surface receptor-like [Nelusetta ayraudi]|uniref:urokinase plasminogen activator surface receptor-like n=1 Tax=Nelusetta ayraudi TaxID=303726 RepID=UPI003F714FB1